MSISLNYSALSRVSVESELRDAPVHKSSSVMDRFRGEQEATWNLLAVLDVAASEKEAQMTAQVFEPAFAQIGGV
jgi:hypothetical protein